MRDGKGLDARLENLHGLITSNRLFFVRNNSVSLNEKGYLFNQPLPHPINVVWRPWPLFLDNHYPQVTIGTETPYHRPRRRK